jgi:hypothetical protein
MAGLRRQYIDLTRGVVNVATRRTATRLASGGSSLLCPKWGINYKAWCDNRV